MTAEEWKQAEIKLSHPYGRINLTADGYELTVISQEYKPLRYHLVINIDGYIKGEWLLKDCEIRRKFLMKHKKCFITAKTKQKKAFRSLSKKDQQEIIDKMTAEWYSFDYPSFRSLKSQLIKNNNEIRFKEK